MIRITVYSGPSDTDRDRPPAITQRETPETQVHEVLRQIGLEWKGADYMTQRQVVITLDPVPAQADIDVKDQVRLAAEALERTGLL